MESFCDLVVQGRGWGLDWGDHCSTQDRTCIAVFELVPPPFLQQLVVFPLNQPIVVEVVEKRFLAEIGRAHRAAESKLSCLRREDPSPTSCSIIHNGLYGVFESFHADETTCGTFVSAGTKKRHDQGHMAGRIRRGVLRQTEGARNSPHRSKRSMKSSSGGTFSTAQH